MPPHKLFGREPTLHVRPWAALRHLRLNDLLINRLRGDENAYLKCVTRTPPFSLALQAYNYGNANNNLSVASCPRLGCTPKVATFVRTRLRTLSHGILFNTDNV